MSRPAAVEGLAGLRPLLGELNDLKRIRRAGRVGSLAGRGFARAWSALIAGERPGLVASLELATAIASVRLGAIDPATLAGVGLEAAEVIEVLVAAVDSVADPLDPRLLEEVRRSIEILPGYFARFDEPARLPSWVSALADQPRAGATRPGHPRLILEPAEGHDEHCYLTAVYAALVATAFEAEPAVPFLAGLAHHLHNARLPDSGFAGEELLGLHLVPIMARLTAGALAELPDPLAVAVVDARRVLAHAETPEARAFHAADVLDRVLQMDYFARASAFELRQALDDLDLVHSGPLQAFQLDVLGAAGLWP